MKLPRDRLVQNRVVTNPETILTNALDSALKGYLFEERIPPFTAGVNPTTPPRTTFNAHADI